MCNKQLLVDILVPWKCRDRQMLIRRIKKAEENKAQGKRLDDLDKLLSLKYSNTDFKNFCEKIYKKYIKETNNAIKFGKCERCGVEAELTGKRCKTCLGQKRLIVCKNCGKTKTHAGYGYCGACYFQLIGKNGRAKK